MRVAAVGLAVGADPATAALPEADLVVLPECAAGGYAHVRRDTTADAQRVKPGVIVGYFDTSGSAAGVWADTGWVSYRKRFLSPAEARVWAPGQTDCVATVKHVRIGVLVCADILQLSAWESLRGRVDVVAVCAAWPHYQDRRRIPGLGWLFDEGPIYRDVLLGRAAAALGVPVVFANAAGPSFDGVCRVWDTNSLAVATGAAVEAEVAPGTPGGRLRHTGRWGPFAAMYRHAARVSGWTRRG